MIWASTHCRRPGDALAQPVEDRPVVVVDAELRTSRGEPSACTPVGTSASARPRVLGAGVERGPGQVEPDRATVGGRRSWPPAGSGAAASGRCPRSRRTTRGSSARAPARRCGRTAGGRGRGPARRSRRCRAAEPSARDEVTGDLGHLEAVGEPVADEVVALRARPPGSWPPAAATPRRARPGRGHARTACARAHPPAWGAPTTSARARRRRTRASGANLAWPHGSLSRRPGGR